MDTLKTITTKNYEITLVQSKDGRYYVGVEQKGKETTISNGMVDMNNALAVFDFKLIEMEGH